MVGEADEPVDLDISRVEISDTEEESNRDDENMFRKRSSKKTKCLIASSQRDTSRMALILAGLSVVFMILLAVLTSDRLYSSLSTTTSTSSLRNLDQQDNGDNNNDDGKDEDRYKEFYNSSCDAIFDSGVALEDRCNYARICNHSKGFPFTSAIFCSTTFSTTTLLFISAVPLAVILIVLFRMLGSTAEDFFSPALETFSMKLGLPPRFAGVTLLALGNGAADVSATIVAISSDQYQMSLGALTGAGMFVGTVVAGVVIVLTPGGEGIKCRGALVRDVLAFAIILGVVYVRFLPVDGQDSRVLEKPVLLSFFGMYVFFVGIVLAADLYHRRVVLPRQRRELDEKERRRQLREERRAQQMAGLALEEDLIRIDEEEEYNNGGLEGCSTVPNRRKALDVVMGALSNYDQRFEKHDVHRNLSGISDLSLTSSSRGWGVAPDEDGVEKMITLHGKHGLLQHHPPHNPINRDEPSAICGDLPTTTYEAMLETADSVDNMRKSLTINLRAEAEEFVLHWREYFQQIFYNEDVHVIDKWLLAFEFPFTVVRQLTVPIPTDGYYRRPIVAVSCALSPYWMIFYLYNHGLHLWSPRLWPWTVAYAAFMAVVGAAVALLAPPGTSPVMDLRYGGPIALYGFVVAATWIDTVADHLVGLLQFGGIVLGIPSAVMGLTVLAWGNSMGDLSANMTMAKKGLANMAITACFAGPIFNILVGLGIGFWPLVPVEVQLPTSIAVGIYFLWANCALLLFTGVVVCRGKIPSRYGYVALILYIAYVAVSIWLQFSGYS